MPVVIEGTPPQPPGYGLLAAVQTVTVNDPRMMDGAEWLPESCAESGAVLIECRGQTADRNPPAAEGVAHTEPFAVWAAFECSPFGWQSIDFVGRAERALLTTQSFQIAAELWSGDLSAQMDDPNPVLTTSTSDTVTSSAATPLNALACLEQALAQCGQGRRGLIHATPQVLVQWIAATAVTKVGGQYVSPMGNIVVADAGYDGSGPGGVAASTSQWAYATDLIRVELGPVSTIPPNLATAEEWAVAMEHRDNTVTVFSQRPALYVWDRCCHVAAQIDLPVCAIGGVS